VRRREGGEEEREEKREGGEEEREEKREETKEKKRGGEREETKEKIEEEGRRGCCDRSIVIGREKMGEDRGGRPKVIREMVSCLLVSWESGG